MTPTPGAPPPPPATAGHRAPLALLVSLRDPHDPMARHEHHCFADMAGLAHERLHVHAMVEGSLPADLPGRYDAVFFGGSGAYSVLDDIPWIREGMAALLRVVDSRVPAWASCFGFQGLALAMGGRVVRDEARTELGATLLHLTEAGKADPLTRMLPQDFWAQEGHHDHVDELPPGVIRLVTGDVSREQAFRVIGAPFWASQFHPELNVTTTVERFLHYLDHYHSGTEDEALQTLHRLQTGQDTPELRSMLALLVREGRHLSP